MKQSLKSRLRIKADISAELAEIKAIVDGGSTNSSKFKSIESVVKKIGKEIEKARLNSMFDSRTGLLSAQFGDELLEREVELSKRGGSVFSAALLDIDFLKYINDNYGHVLGTRVIVRIAKELKKAVRRSDIVCRYGGDEFLIIFPETKKNRAAEVLKRIRLGVQKMEFSKGLKVTLSVGMGEYRPSSKQSATRFLTSVDKSLYKAKENRINVNLK